MLKYFDSVDRQ